MAISIITTGMERSLFVRIEKQINGQNMDPYMYDGCSEFAYSGRIYGQISTEQMAIMPLSNYMDRLNDFKAYVMEMEPGLDFNRDALSEDNKPYRQNLTHCAIAASSI